MTGFDMTGARHDERVRLLIDQADIAAAVHRYAEGLDHGDAEVLTSALTEDAVVDLSAATARIGFEFPALRPRDVVVDTLIAAVGPLDTSHSITNLRVTVHGDTATARCYAMAQHFPPGEGSRPDKTRHALMMNRYTAELVRCPDLWRIARLTIDNAWFEGDPTVLLQAS